MRRHRLASFYLVHLLAGCAQPEPVLPLAASVPFGPDELYRPARLAATKLQYAPDRVPFPPLISEQTAYPTQAQANAAYLRLLADTSVGQARASAITVFGCKPGALDAQTARIRRDHGLVVHCALDLLDGEGRRHERMIANFYDIHKLWHMQPLDPPRAPVAWRNPENSPRDAWWWLPGRARYE